MVRKVVLYIFIPFLAFLLMSHNVFAVELTPAVRYKTGYVMPYWSDSNNRPYATGGYNYSTNGDYVNADVLYFKSGTNTNISVAAGNYVSLTGNLTITVSSNSQAVSIQANPRQYFVIGTSSVDCPVLSFDETSFQQTTTNSTNVWTLRYNFSSVCRLRSSVSQNVAMNISLRAPSATGTDTLRFVPTYMAIWEPVEGYDDSAVIEAIQNINDKLQDVIDALDILSDKMDNVASSISEAQENEEQATQDASDQAQQDADSSSSDAAQGTSSLISSIGSAVSVISSASPTNCKINGNMGNLNMGQIDLCANPVPSFVQIITSLLLILITVPLCITLFNRFIALFRSFQG